MCCSFPPQTSAACTEFSFSLEFHTHLKEVLPVIAASFILELLLVPAALARD